jgi:hypothetical protein
MKISLMLLSLVFIFSSVDLDEVRALYKEASESKQSVQVLMDKLNHVNEGSKAVLVAYKGASIALSAREMDKVKDKMSVFKEGKRYIEIAISKDSMNLEVRWIRLTVQENSPKAAKYKGELEVDKSFILAHFNQENSPSVKKMIRDYIAGSRLFDENEISMLDE